MTNIMEGCSDMPCVVIVDAVFALLVVCAVSVGVAGGVETHVFGPLIGKEERFRRARGWL